MEDIDPPIPISRRREYLDGIIVAKLQGAAFRLAAARGDFEEAVAELATIAEGRGDLLSEAAGLVLGFYSPTMADWPMKSGAGRALIAAGADRSLLQHWAEIGRSRARDSPTAARDGEPMPAFTETGL